CAKNHTQSGLIGPVMERLTKLAISSSSSHTYLGLCDGAFILESKTPVTSWACVYVCVCVCCCVSWCGSCAERVSPHLCLCFFFLAVVVWLCVCVCVCVCVHACLCVCMLVCT